MKLHKDSHVDHGLTDRQLGCMLERFGDHSGFFKFTIELPDQYGTVPCALYGPLMGDEPVAESAVSYERRGDRAWPSRVRLGQPRRQTRKVTIVAGPHGDEDCVLYTVYGGPEAPQEPGDPGCRDKAASEAFWAVHALAR